MRFSERQGIQQPRDVVQTDEIDVSLRNSLWNVIQVTVLRPLDRGGAQVADTPSF